VTDVLFSRIQNFAHRVLHELLPHRNTHRYYHCNLQTPSVDAYLLMNRVREMALHHTQAYTQTSPTDFNLALHNVHVTLHYIRVI